MKPLLDGLKALGPMRLAAMGAVTIGMMVMLSLLALRNDAGRMALLYGDLDLQDSGRMVQQLKSQHIPFRLEAGGARILVPASQVPAARVALARNGLPSGGSVGYELFDRSDSFAATDFQQRINETRALEGELDRTIRAIHGVRTVRVHLVLPHREPFSSQQQEAQASVLIDMAGAAGLDREGVQAILNLVAAAVPGLRAHNIAIVDTRGDLLARAGQPVGPLGQAATSEALQQAVALRLSRAVEQMLGRTLGQGHVRAEASVRMNFDRINEKDERFNPDGKVARSEQSVTQKSKNTEANSTVTVKNNLPNANAGNTGAGSEESRQEDTTNYEISRTVRTLIRDQPQIARISLAVMVDGTETPGKDGKPVWKPRSPEELKRITTLVKSAIGFDAKRGDQVEVVSMRFRSEAPPPPPPPGFLGFRLEKADIMHLAQTALFGLVALFAMLFVLRPMVIRLTTLAPEAPGVGALPPGAAPGLEGPQAAALGGPQAAAALGVEGVGAGALPGMSATPLLEDESMVNIAQIEGQMRASSLRRIAELVEKHPDETLVIMRGWMMQESNG